MQQYHFDIQREILRNTLVTVAYVGSKGTHITLQNDLNQLHDLPPSQNLYPKGVPISNDDCGNAGNGNDVFVGGQLVTGDALLRLNVA